MAISDSEFSRIRNKTLNTVDNLSNLSSSCNLVSSSLNTLSSSYLTFSSSLEEKVEIKNSVYIQTGLFVSGNVTPLEDNKYSIGRLANTLYEVEQRYWKNIYSYTSSAGLLNSTNIAVSETASISSIDADIINVDKIKFNNSSTDAFLDDYEEGEYTPLTGSYHSFQWTNVENVTGRYIKIGNLVTVWITLTGTSAIDFAAGAYVSLPMRGINETGTIVGTCTLHKDELAADRDLLTVIFNNTIFGSDRLIISKDNSYNSKLVSIIASYISL